MEKNHTVTLIVIGMLTLIITVAGASYAYFASAIDIDDSIPVGVQTEGSSASFMSVSSGGINIGVDSHLMQQANSDDNNTVDELTDKATLSIYLNSAKDSTVSTCHYDIIFVWNKDAHKYSKTPNTTKEFTITGTVTNVENIPEFSLDDPNKARFRIHNPEFEEINIDELDWQTKTITETVDDASVKKEITYAVLINDAIISSLYLNKATIVNWQFDVKFYNVTKDQSSLMEKKYGGEIRVDPDSIKC